MFDLSQLHRRLAIIFLSLTFGIATALGGSQPASSATTVLQSVQTQVLPNQHVRVLLQFSAPASIRQLTAGAATTVIFQVQGATAASTIQNIMPINLGPLTTINVSSFPGGLSIALALSGPVHPTFGPGGGNGVYIIDVPPASGGSNNGYRNPFQPQQNQYQAPAPSTPGGPQITKLIRLHYADVSEVVGILTSNGEVAPTSVFNPQPSQFGSQSDNGGGFNGGGFQGPVNGGFNAGGFNGGGFQQPFGGYNNGNYGGENGNAMGQRISDNIAIDRRLNAVILTGTPAEIAQAEQMIKLLDVPVQSVLLDTEVLEVTESGAKALGLDYNQTTTDPITRIFNTQAAIMGALPAGAVPGSLAIQSNIFLLVSKGLARVLASPKILTEDGVPASILTGDSLPIRVTTPVGFNGATAVSSQVEYINVGVNLQILPHITTGGGVNADIYSVVSSVTGFTSSNDPQISTRQAQTRVNLLEGQTLVIGGLLQQRDIRNLQKIPILGDLPLVGALFRFYTETRQDTNLIITITPHIVPEPGSSPAPAQSAAPAPTPTP
ncbi:MAG TPA: secretin N-terminal domain-containing protein [Candidatus Eremiobacteraceae bacterium]|nr:secretin N-terminal domain-containing protein [Candidatus Eremiobacteraceae bacterium]